MSTGAMASAIAMLLGLACASEDTGDNLTFGGHTSAQTTAPSSGGLDTMADDGSDGAEGGTGDTGGASGDGGSGADDGTSGDSGTSGPSSSSSSSTTDPTTSSSSSTTDPTTSSSSSSSSSSSTTTGGGHGNAGEMYSHCTDDPNVCGALPLCVQISDTMTMEVLDGFCTNTDCADAASDCDPSPGGTAVPICTMVDTDSVCALDCSAGKTCPTGMMCWNVGVEICA